MSEDMKETNEVIAGVEQAVADVSEPLKDGFQAGDVAVIAMNVLSHLSVYKEAVEGAPKSLDELKEMKKSDLLRLAAAQMNKVADLLDAQG